MDISLVLSVEDTADVDNDHSTGLTVRAYDRLVEGLMEAGFSIVEGPTKSPKENVGQ